MTKVLLAALALAMLASDSKAASIEVQLVDPQGATVAGTVVAEPLGSLAEQAGPQEALASGGSTRLSLGPGLWSVRARAGKRWCAASQAYVREGVATPASIKLTLWPVGRLTGTLRSPPGEKLPANMTLRVHRDMSPRGFAQARPLDSIECPVASGRWSCEVPATTPLDLQIEVARLAPRYLWNITATEGGTKDVGATSLFRGASVAGFVLDDQERPLRPNAAVEATAPDGTAIRSPAGASHTFSASTDERGFFQIGPLPAGAYHVQASAGARVSEPAWVRLNVDDHEERLAAPLEPVPPVTLRLEVDPPRDPQDRPWRIRLLTWRGQHAGHRLVKGESIGADGTWSRAGLPAGDNYRLSIASSNGDTWANRTLSLRGDTVFERVTLEVLNIEGSASMGAEPLMGRLQLTDRTSGVGAWFRMDESGDFAGAFPGVDLSHARWVAQIESSTPRMRRRLTRVQPESVGSSSLKFRLRLDDGAIDGSVVNESGAPQGGVLVEAKEHELDSGEQSSANELDVRTAPDGSFRMPGLATGEYRLVATGVGGTGGYESVSEVVSVRVSDSQPGKVRLVLKNALTLHGRVVTPAGAPVSGVTVIVGSADSLEVSARPQTSDADGRFDAKLPAGTRRIVMMMWAQGIGRRVLGRNLPEDGTIQVELNPLAGGQIILDLGQPDSDLSSIWVYHDGGFDHIQLLAAWAAQNGSAQRGDVLRLPLMDPGTYRLCRLRGAFEYSAFMAGTLGKDRCLAGDLPPAGELQLEVPPPLTRASSHSENVERTH